jgi:hypothetical protein
MTDASVGPVTIAVSTGVQSSRCHHYRAIADDCDDLRRYLAAKYAESAK